MHNRHVCGPSLLFLLIVVPCLAAQKHISVDTGECGGEVTTKDTISKSARFTDKVRGLNAYGEVSFRHSTADAAKNQCHVIYRLFVSIQGKPFTSVKQLSWDTEDGEIAGIDLVGLSPDGTKFAANFWLAEGDGQEHRPVIYDLETQQTIYRPLEDKIQKLINGCDQVEDFIGVTDSSEAIFAVPPSDEDDSPGCGDKGLWRFDLKTGRVYRVAKLSGDRW
jgi:hypothetical protein